MAETIDCPALDEVQVTLALVIPQPRAIAAHEYERRPFGDLHQGLDREVGEIHRVVLSRGTGTKKQKAASVCGLSVTFVVYLRRARRRMASRLTRRRTARVGRVFMSGLSYASASTVKSAAYRTPLLTESDSGVA